MTSGQLLGRFVEASDESSFRALVDRHGPTVLRACRRVLADPQDADDAFQATFLVLLRKAPSIRDPERLDRWLGGVARRVALRARRGAARRREHERRRAEMQPVGGMPESRPDELARVVREELDRLPRSYREPLELCYLRGRSHEEAAAELGWPLGTLKTRLVRGRRRLRERLDRRGATLGLALLLLLLRRSEAAPEALAESTVAAMLAASRGWPPPADPRFARASALAREVIAALSATRRAWTLPALLAALALLAATGAGAAALAREAAEREAEVAALPANLTDVLNVDCE